MNEKKRILVAPLNWGLGHATRCIPIIKAFQKHGCEVLVASDGAALALLRAEFPTIKAIEFPAYHINYRSANMMRNMVWQLPKIARAVFLEYLFLQKIILQERINVVVSDNRFGCFSRRVPCIFITHQINIRTPKAWATAFVNIFNHSFIKQFDSCWIPDVASQTDNLSGELSHPATLPNVCYIGILSRMQPTQLPQQCDYDWCIILSGPEPQRTYFEHIIAKQLYQTSRKVAWVLGDLKGKKDKYLLPENVSIFPFLTANLLNDLMNRSRFILARSGYSTLMDVAQIGKPALFIPTPGQPEQLYLAQKTTNQQQFLVQEQDALNIEKAYQMLSDEQLKKVKFESSEWLLDNSITDFLKRYTL